MDAFKVNQLVRLHSLKVEKYNGRIGCVKTPLDRGRHAVKLYDDLTIDFWASASNTADTEVIIRIKPESLSHVCNSCHKSIENSLFCGGCKTATYCNTKSQHDNWKSQHKSHCKHIEAYRCHMKNPVVTAAQLGHMEQLEVLI